MTVKMAFVMPLLQELLAKFALETKFDDFGIHAKLFTSRHTPASRRLVKSFEPMAKARILAQIGIL